MNNWYLEIARSIFCNADTEEMEKRGEELFPHLHLMCTGGYFSIAACVLDGPLTDVQKDFLEISKTSGGILEYYARDQVNWVQMPTDMICMPLMCSCGRGL